MAINVMLLVRKSPWQRERSARFLFKILGMILQRLLRRKALLLLVPAKIS
jgi:hypothetical protein